MNGRARRLNIAFALAVLLVSGASGLFTYGLISLARVSARVDANQRADTSALCTLRSDLQSRVTSGATFLRQHPKGIAGIPAATLRASINSQQRTIHALASIVCPPR